MKQETEKMNLHCLRAGRKRLKNAVRAPNGKSRNSYAAQETRAMWWYGFFKNPMGLYVVANDQSVKIGVSRNPDGRLLTLQTSNHKKLRIIDCYWAESGDIRRLERAIHASLRRSNFHAGGEWYYMSPETALGYVKREAEIQKIKTWADNEWGCTSPMPERASR